ncbi:hypothetical protein V6C42_11510 [Pseudoclostridium thermosuccinogenes]|jgi:hypothetical protein|uniref:hypothetical protein n=1 Tax=Clostridium thermosuccinogenes TaxID=84032 RepID=UPI000CCBFF94|nr:hypothetical protein [Pseudoclostridium thermosuccinogenes]PNT92211.1 hypothetical protein CDQ83_01135 [Pseudoclostridium thermosuccinogenes]
MKKVFCYFCLIVALLLSGCSLNIKDKQRQELESQIADLTEKLQTAEDKIEELEKLIEKTPETNIRDAAPEVHMIPEKICGYKMMTLDNVDVKGIPNKDAKTNRRISYQLVDVLVTVHAEPYNIGEATESDLWALIHFHQFDSTSDTIGWVPWSSLVTYTNENKELLTYPVTLAEDCVDLDTGETVSWDEVAVRYTDDYAIVSWYGGKTHKVDKKYIIYPDPDQINADIAP